MKILIINNLGTIHGGAEAMISHLKEGLKKEGHQVRVLSGSEKGNGEVLADARFRTFGEKSKLLRILYVFNPFALAALWREIRTFRPDIVHLHNVSKASPAILILLKNHPTILTLHDHTLFDPTRLDDLPLLKEHRRSFCNFFIDRPSLRFYLEKLRFAMLRKLSGSINTTLACSIFYQRCAQHSGIFRNIKTLHNGIELCPYTPIKNKKQILFVGRLNEEKGLPVLLEAIFLARKEYPDIILCIAGSGKETENIRRESRRLGIEDITRMAGFSSRKQIVELYKDSAVVIVPSVSAENLPTVCIEAMSAGRPVIASNSGGIPEIIDDGVTGILVPPGDAEAVSRALGKLLSDPGLMEKIGKAGREKAEREFSIDTYIQNTLSEYKKLIKQ